MAESATKLPVRSDKGEAATSGREWHPLVNLQRQIDRLFEDFGAGFFGAPFRSMFDPMGSDGMNWAVPAADMVEKDDGFEITAELPGIGERDVDVSLAGGVLTIKGEKKETKEEKRKGYYLSERRFGSFRRSFRLPEGVDADRIEANFQKGVLTVKLPKTAEARKPEKKITVKAA